MLHNFVASLSAPLIKHSDDRVGILKFGSFSNDNGNGNEKVKNVTGLERFSFECRKVIGFAFTTLRDWLKRFAPLFYPIRRKTKTNCVTLACIFPRFASATCNYFEF